jgi:peptidoglycan-associated lipoprotein
MTQAALMLFALLGLVSCTTTSEQAAPIEQRTPAPAAATPDPASAAAPSGLGTATAPLAQPIASAGATAAAPARGSMDPALTDPRSPLSKRSIYFDYDSFVVKDEFKPLVEAHAAYLKRNPRTRIVIEGHADERGSREYNLALGQKRAEAVKRVMALLGVAEAQIDTVSFGEEKPRRTGTTEADYAENRRGDIRYVGE